MKLFKKLKNIFKSMDRKQIAVLTVCFAFLLTTFAGVLGSRELSFENKTADTAMGYDILSVYSVEETANDSDFNMEGTPLKDDVFKPAVTRMITKNAELQVETEKYETLTKFIEGKVKDLYGYVELCDEYTPKDKSERVGYMIIRIPANDLEAFIKLIEEESTILSKSVKTNDITSDYVDTESQLGALMIEQDTLINLLSKAETLSDTIQIQDRLTEVNSKIQYYESMMMRLNEDVEHSSICITINEVERTQVSDGGFLTDMKNALTDSLYNIVKGFKIMSVWFVSALPFVAILIVCVIILKSIIKVFKNKKDRGVELGAEDDGTNHNGGQTNS